MKLAALAVAAALVPATVLAHPHIVISQAVRAIESNGVYTHVEIVWKFDPHASEDEIPAIDEDKDGKFSEEEIRLLIRDTMPSFHKAGFLTWLDRLAPTASGRDASSLYGRPVYWATWTVRPIGAQ